MVIENRTTICQPSLDKGPLIYVVEIRRPRGIPVSTLRIPASGFRISTLWILDFNLLDS